MEKTIKKLMGSSYFILILLAVISFLVLTPVVNMIVLGAIISYGIKPISKRLRSKLRFNSISIILAIVLVVIPLLLILIYCLSTLLGFASTFLRTSSFSSHSLANETAELVSTYLPTELQGSTEYIISAIGGFINDILALIFSNLVSFIKSVPMISLQLFVLLASIYYFTKDGSNLKDYGYAFVPDDRKDYFSKMFQQIKIVLKSIFYGHFLTGIVIGILASIGYFILGYPYALFFGILTGILQLIPIIGPWPVYFALFLTDLVNKNYIRAVIVLLFGFGLSLSDMYIRPALAGRYVDIHPLILLLGFLAGPIVFGVAGFILGPLILGITYAVIKTYKEERERLNQV